VRPSSEAERRRLNDLFAELCAIASPFGHEAACAQRVRAELERLGLEVTEDGAAEEAGAECGNLLARIPGRGERTVLLCAHVDTVPEPNPIEPVLVDDGWESAGETILGADNKAAIAVMLAVAHRAAVEGSPVGLELLFTVSEENALAGAKAFDVGQLRSDFGYVYDHATPIGEVVMASPTLYRLRAAFHGKAAHAGIRPEDGRSAIVAAARAISSLRLGRLDEETTANVGAIEGGVGGTNVVPEHASFLAEARSLDNAKVEALVAEMVDRVHDAANDPLCDVDADVTVERLFEAYRQPEDAPGVQVAHAALRASGYEPRAIVSGGASDANAFEANGLHCVCLANGTERNHETTERVSVAALESMLDVSFALLDAAAEHG
jgi:tripeptide aminopeptidase